SFPKHKQGMAMAIYGMGVVVAPILGPTLGGWITDDYSWRWIFFINILVGALLWELYSRDPVVDLRMLKDRNFALATFTMFMLGFVLYGSTVLLPLLLQTLMGYTALLSG